MKRELVYMDAKSSKFWSIELAGSSHTVTYGRIGTTGQTATKSFPSEEAARKDMEKLIREKLGKGYVDAVGSGVGEGAGAGATSGAGGLIPPVAFSHINRREDVGRNAGTFIGQRVVDYDPEKPARTDVIYRFRSDWDEPKILPHLEHFLTTNAAAEAVGIVIGAWHGDDPYSNRVRPLDELYSLITRADVNNEGKVCPAADWQKMYLITAEEALPMMTVNAAYALFREDEVGSLEPGKYADLIVLSANPITDDPQVILDIEVWMTMVGGRTAYCMAGQEELCP